MDKKSIQIHKTNMNISREKAIETIGKITKLLKSFESDYLTTEDWSEIDTQLRIVHSGIASDLESLQMLRADLDRS